jgi:hypothetical protein
MAWRSFAVARPGVGIALEMTKGVTVSLGVIGARAAGYTLSITQLSSCSSGRRLPGPVYMTVYHSLVQTGSTSFLQVISLATNTTPWTVRRVNRFFTFSPFKENLMRGNTRLQMVGVLAVGVLLGYLAASDGANPFARAKRTSQDSEGRTVGAEDPCMGRACCTQGGYKELRVALQSAEDVARVQKDGKRPNILVNWGD